MISPVIHIILRLAAGSISAYIFTLLFNLQEPQMMLLVFVLLSVLLCSVLVSLYLSKTLLPDLYGRLNKLSRQVEHLNRATLVSETDLNGVITYVNDGFCKTSQYDREELIGQTHQILNSNYHNQKFWSHYWQVISSGKVWQGEIRNKAKDGSYYWVFAIVSAITDNHGVQTGYRAVRVDITDVKIAEMNEINRRERQAKFNEAIVKLNRHESFITHDYSKLLLFITKTVSDVLNLQRVSIWTLDHDEQGSFIHLSNLWDQGESRCYRNLSLHSTDFPAYFKALKEDRMLIYDDVYKEPDLVDFRDAYFPDNNIKSMLDTPFYLSGQLAGVLCCEQTETIRHWHLDEQAFLLSVADILNVIFESSKRLESEQNMRHSEKLEALGNLTSGIAHDFNNMLGVVMGYSEILTNKLENDPTLLNYANQIHSASLRGAKLTANLLSFSRKNKTQKEPLLLERFVHEHLEMLQKTLTVAISVTHESEDSGCCVNIDRSELEHALLNLCINSMHALEDVEEPEVRLLTFKRRVSDLLSTKLGIPVGTYCVLSVVDNGCGIEPHVLNRVLDPFYTTKGDKGTGLGLTQVDAFMNRSDGALDIESTVGIGTIVSLYIPQYVSDEKAGKSVHAEIDVVVMDSNNERILIVDDQPEVCVMTAEILSNHGYQTHSVHSAIDALTYLENNKVDLVLTDVVMPQMDGYLFTAKLNKLYPGLKIQLMTGFSENHDHSIIDKHLLDEMLLKPFEPSELLAQVGRVLHSK